VTNDLQQANTTRDGADEHRSDDGAATKLSVDRIAV